MISSIVALISSSPLFILLSSSFNLAFSASKVATEAFKVSISATLASKFAFTVTSSLLADSASAIALAAASLGSGLDTISSNVSESSGNSNTSNNSGSNNGSDNSNTNSTSSSGTKSGGMLSKLAKAGKSIGKKVVSAFKGLFGKGRDDESGYGDDPYHIYQRDYKGSFHTTGDSENQTIADSGCGPAAAASLLRMYGKDGDMNNAVNYALNNKYKEVDGGTYPEYFNDYLNKNGISTNSNADNNDVVDSLIHNKPVILMGRDSTTSGKTPYGSKYSHYVVARGLDKNGNVIVEDSEDKNGSTRYSLADTLNNSSVRITTGKGRYGRAKDNVMDSYVGGVNSVMSAAISNIIGNVAGSIVNLGTGTIEIFKEAFSGEYFTQKDWLAANAEYFKYVAPNILGTGKEVKTDKVSLFIQYFDVLSDNKKDWRNWNTRRSRILNFFGRSLWLPYKSGEHYMQSIPYIGLAINTKLYDENGNDIKNRFAYFKTALESNFSKLENLGKDLYPDDDSLWKDFEI